MLPVVLACVRTLVALGYGFTGGRALYLLATSPAAPPTVFGLVIANFFLGLVMVGLVIVRVHREGEG